MNWLCCNQNIKEKKGCIKIIYLAYELVSEIGRYANIEQYLHYKGKNTDKSTRKRNLSSFIRIWSPRMARLRFMWRIIPVQKLTLPQFQIAY